MDSSETTNMDETTEPILKVRKGGSERGSGANCCKKRRTVVVEPVMFMYALALNGSGPVVEQYLYARFKLQYSILNKTVESNDSNPCLVNHSDPYFIATQAVQEETSRWQMYLQIACSSVAVFTTLVYGPYSDVAGRRIVILSPSLAAVVKFSVNAFIIFFNLPVWCLLFGQFLEGLSGGFETMIMIVFAYIADITSPEDRGLRLTIAESMLAFAMAIAQLGLGYFMREAGFLYPYLTLCGILVINLIYVIFFVPETVGANSSSAPKCTTTCHCHSKGFSVVRSFKATYKAFTETKDHRNVKVGLLLVVTFFCSIPLISRFTMVVLFTMNMPLCWGPAKIGLFAATSNIAVEFGAITSLKLFKLCGLPEMWVAAIGTVSIMAGSLTNAFATTDLMMYMVVVASVFISLPVPMCRTMISRLVSAQEQGTMFAGMASIGAINNIASTLVMNIIYQKTLFFMNGFIFVVGGLSAFAAFCVLVCYIILATFDSRRKRHVV